MTMAGDAAAIADRIGRTTAGLGMASGRSLPRPVEGERFGAWTWYPELLARPVPRYTSYPTAAEFVDAPFAEAQAAALAALSGPVSLYLHIPFCEQICCIVAATPARPTAASASRPISAR